MLTLLSVGGGHTACRLWGQVSPMKRKERENLHLQFVVHFEASELPLSGPQVFSPAPCEKKIQVCDAWASHSADRSALGAWGQKASGRCAACGWWDRASDFRENVPLPKGGVILKDPEESGEEGGARQTPDSRILPLVVTGGSG